MRRRAFLQLLSLAGVSVSLGLPELPPAEQDRILEEIAPELWCKIMGIDISPWLHGLTITQHGGGVQQMLDVTDIHTPYLREVTLTMWALPDEPRVRFIDHVFFSQEAVPIEFGVKYGPTYSAQCFLKNLSVDCPRVGDIPVQTFETRLTGPVTLVDDRRIQSRRRA